MEQNELEVYEYNGYSITKDGPLEIRMERS